MHSLLMILSVAAGGAIGSVARFTVMSGVGRITTGGFPYGTLLVNTLGGFIMGALIEFMAQRWSASEAMRAFLTVGILGGFTTFSTFALDFVMLAEHRLYTQAVLYAMLSVGLAVGGVFAGMGVLRGILAG